MEILQNNPYRLLGVYSNSPTKERLANHNRMKAFLKVGKPVSFPLDLSRTLLPLNRTEVSVADAEAKLTLPQDQLLYAQFWFVKTTPLDDVAFKHLVDGDIAKAEEIWRKRDCASSLQNRIVCALMREDYGCAITCAEMLYGNVQYVSQLVSAIVGNGGNFETQSLAFSFLNTLCEEVGANKLLPFISNDAWKSHIGEKAVTPLIDSIQEAIGIAKQTKGKGANARLEAGKTLRDDTKNALAQLKGYLSVKELRYQTIADKLGLEILQCGIDYFNDSEEPDAALKAMSLQKYAKSIVVGQMAKERCKENVDILQKIIDNLPPLEVFAEDRAIKEELHKYCKLPDKICHAVTLLNNVMPYLIIIKNKLGITDEYYLKISTQIANNALHNIIAEVNEAQKYDPAEERRQMYKKMKESDSPFGYPFLFRDPLYSLYNDDFLNASADREKKYENLKRVILAAREALLIIDKLDMEKIFEQERYLPNRKTLNDFLIQIGKVLPAYKPLPLKERIMLQGKEALAGASRCVKSWWNEVKEEKGCLFAVVFTIICAIIGAAMDKRNGAEAGFVFGIVILGLITKIMDLGK